MDPVSFLNEKWWEWFLINYKTSITAVPMIVVGSVTFILKFLAVIDKKNPKNTIRGWIDLISQEQQSSGLPFLPPVPRK
jgi:hypothetical protein